MILQILSWAAFVATTASVILTIFKKRSSWIIGLIVNGVWLLYGCATGQPALIACQVIFIPLNIWGLFKWK